MSLKFRGLLTFAFALVVANGALAAEAKRPNNLILFVADGLRALSVTADTAPAMAAVREVGVNFKNPHSVFPTFTTANASAMATGHQLGDTGNYKHHNSGLPQHQELQGIRKLESARRLERVAHIRALAGGTDAERPVATNDHEIIGR